MKLRQRKKLNKYARELLLTCFEFIEEDFYLDGDIWMCVLQNYYCEDSYYSISVLYLAMYNNDIKSIKECRKLARAGVRFR